MFWGHRAALLFLEPSVSFEEQICLDLGDHSRLVQSWVAQRYSHCTSILGVGSLRPLQNGRIFQELDEL